MKVTVIAYLYDMYMFCNLYPSDNLDTFTTLFDQWVQGNILRTLNIRSQEENFIATLYKYMRKIEFLCSQHCSIHHERNCEIVLLGLFWM